VTEFGGGNAHRERRNSPFQNVIGYAERHDVSNRIAARMAIDRVTSVIKLRGILLERLTFRIAEGNASRLLKERFCSTQLEQGSAKRNGRLFVFLERVSKIGSASDQVLTSEAG